MKPTPDFIIHHQVDGFDPVVVDMREVRLERHTQIAAAFLSTWEAMMRAGYDVVPHSKTNRCPWPEGRATFEGGLRPFG